MSRRRAWRARTLLLAATGSALSWLAAPASRAAEALVEPTFVVDGPSGDEVPGEIAIDVQDEASPAMMADIAARYAITMHPSSRWSTTHDQLEVAEVDPSREDFVLQALSVDPRVQHVERMALYRATYMPDDPLYSDKQWHLQRVGAGRAWPYACGAGVVVAVIDTGIACFDAGPFSRGTDLAGTRCEGGWNFVDDSAAASDDQGHGTHVAGTIAQTTNNGVGGAGLAPCAVLMPVKVLTRQGFGTVANVAEGIRFAADEGAQIINLSLGGPIKSQILRDAIDHALDKGVLVIAAAGNSGRSVGWPAAYPGVLAVTATDSADSIAWFSSRGPEVGIAAPGVAVTQQTICDGGRNKCELFGTFNGTSMASPHVAGAAALVESLGVTHPEAVRAVLAATARAAAGSDRSLYGDGVVDAGAAVVRVFWRHVAVRTAWLLGLLWIVAGPMRRRGHHMALGPASVLGLLVAGPGLFPVLPLFDWVPRSHLARVALDLAMHPLGDWDIALAGVGVHRWMSLGSCLPVVVLTLGAFANRRVRPFIGGVALGTVAFVLQSIGSGETAFVGGPLLGWMWAFLNVVVCLWIGRVALEASPRPKPPSSAGRSP